MCRVTGQPDATLTKAARQAFLKTDDGSPAQVGNASGEPRSSLRDELLEMLLGEGRRHAPLNGGRDAILHTLGRKMSETGGEQTILQLLGFGVGIVGKLKTPAPIAVRQRP